MKKLLIVSLLTLSLALGGCAGMSDTEQRTLSGAAIGTAADDLNIIILDAISIALLCILLLCALRADKRSGLAGHRPGAKPKRLVARRRAIGRIGQRTNPWTSYSWSLQS